MLRAEIGDYLYIIIFAVLMFAGVLEKMAKAKRQQQNTPPPQPYDDFEDVDEQSEQGQAPPQTLEEIMRRMMQTSETQSGKEIIGYPEEAQSLDIIPETRYNHYQPIVNQITDLSGKDFFAPNLIEEVEVTKFHEYEFDVRQAVIASEILNRKY